MSEISRNSEDVAEYYDNWASDYDSTLEQWQYDAPKRVAQMLGKTLSKKAVILDAGCGTGLSGRALAAEGFAVIDGIDISESSLEEARQADVYRSLASVNMQQIPFPLESDRYDGLSCVGVLTYLPDSTGTLKEFARIVKPGGAIAATQRDDIFEERNFQKALDLLQEQNIISAVEVSEPMPYLPQNKEFADKIRVRYIRFSSAV